MQRFLCLVFGHRKIKGKSRLTGGHHYADCTRCGVTLFREPEGTWRSARPEDYQPRTLDLTSDDPATEQPAPHRRDPS